MNVRIKTFLSRLILLPCKQKRSAWSLAYRPLQPSIQSVTGKVLQEPLHPCLAQQQWLGLCGPCRLWSGWLMGMGRWTEPDSDMGPRCNTATLLGMSWPSPLSTCSHSEQPARLSSRVVGMNKSQFFCLKVKIWSSTSPPQTSLVHKDLMGGAEALQTKVCLHWQSDQQCLPLLASLKPRTWKRKMD